MIYVYLSADYENKNGIFLSCPVSERYTNLGYLRFALNRKGMCLPLASPQLSEVYHVT
jgi:hypothetical protein